jgi:hypothetical protein
LIKYDLKLPTMALAQAKGATPGTHFSVALQNNAPLPNQLQSLSLLKMILP